LRQFAGERLDARRAEGDGNVARVAVVGDPLDEQFDDAGLFAWGEC
jgi:hypothetical protein